MTWSICLAFLGSVIFSAQIIFGVGQTATPWESEQSAGDFIASFQRAIALSKSFANYQQDDMSTIPKTITAAMENFNGNNTNSKIKFQALNMIFASAIVENIVAERGVNLESKINSIENALNSAFQETFGTTNPQFVSEITNLIYTIAHISENRESTVPVIKVEKVYKQKLLREQVPSSSEEVMRINRALPQRGTEQQRPPTLDSSMPLYVPGGSQGSSLQSAFEQVRGSPVIYSQGLSGFVPQGSSLQMPYGVNQQGTSDYRTGVATGGGIETAKQTSFSSELNRLQQQGSYGNEKSRFESSSQGKSGAVSLKTGGDIPSGSTPATSGSYAVGNVISGQPEPSGPGILEPSKAVNQRPGNYGTRAAASTLASEKEPGGNPKGYLDQVTSSGSKEQEQNSRRASVDVDQRRETSKSNNFGWSETASVSGGMAGFRPFLGKGRPQERKVPIGKDTKGSNAYASSSAIAAATDSNVTSIEEERYREEGKDVQKASGTGSQRQYGTLYQKLDRFGGQTVGVYPSGAVAAPSSGEYRSVSSGKVSEEQDPSGQRSLDVGGQGIAARKSSETKDRSRGPKDYGNNIDSAVSTAKSGYEIELGRGVKRLPEPKEQGLTSNGSTVDGRANYASGRATSIVVTGGGDGSTGSTILSNILTRNDSSEVSSAVSSSVSGSSTKPMAFTDTVTSIASQISNTNPDWSYCNVLIEALLEIISTLVNLVESCNSGQFNFHTFIQNALITGKNVTKNSN